MLPLQVAGLALAGKALLSKYNKQPKSSKRKVQFVLPSLPSKIKNLVSNVPDTTKQISTIVNRLASPLKQVSKAVIGENYNAVIKGHIPAGAVLLVPQNPLRSENILLADLDGDSQNELVASYKYDKGIRTIVLKKQNERWNKAAEIDSEGHEVLNYRGTADITGEGKKHLLLGLKSAGKSSTLYGYALENNYASKMFEHNYSRFEAFTLPDKRVSGTKAHLAFWTARDPGGYNIETLHWDGLQLEPAADEAYYYKKSVVPYYVNKVRQSPYSPSGWYNFADALTKAGAHKDALDAVNMGMVQDTKHTLDNQFTALKNGLAMK